MQVSLDDKVMVYYSFFLLAGMFFAGFGLYCGKFIKNRALRIQS
jgi:hypothetical protein